MKIKLTFILLFLTLIGFAQNQKNDGSVVYKINASEKKNTTTIENSNILFYNKTISRLDDIKYHLQFSKDKSLFKMESALTNDSDKSDFFLKSAKLLGGEEIYFTDLKDKKVTVQKSILGEVFLIQHDINYNWKLTSETKSIANYKCLKAEMILKKSKIYVNDIKVIAWFAPEIPIAFGPNGYGGLPGLILELNFGDLNYYATEVKFDKELQFNKPTEGIKITSEDFENYISQKIDEYGFENKRKN